MLIVAVVVSLSMVAFFTEGGCGSGTGVVAGDFGSIAGRPFTRDEFFNAQREVIMAILMRTGKPPGSDEQMRRTLERETLARLLLLHKLKEEDIQPSTKAVGRVTQERIGDYPYDKLLSELVAPAGLTPEDFERFMRHEAGIQQLVATAGLSAKLVDPREAEVIYRREHQEMKVDLAVFWASNYLDQVVITNGAIGTYFTNRMAVYRVPERIELAYVEFAHSNYMAEAEKELGQITNLTAIVDEVFLKAGGTNAFPGTNGLPMTEAAAKQKIKDDELRRRSYVGARRAAAAFGNTLMSQPTPHTFKTFEDAAATNSHTIKVSPPFDRVRGLEDTDFPPEFRARGLALMTNINPIAYSPIAGSNSVYVVALKGRIPSEMPQFEKVQDKVTSDFKNGQARELATKAGTGFHTNLTNGLFLGKSFDELVAAHQVKVVSLPSFSASSDTLTNLDPRINFSFVQRMAQDLEPGKAAGFIPSVDGGSIVYLRQRQPVDEEKVKKELPNFISALRQYRQNEAFQRWFGKQAELARLTPPKRESELDTPVQIPQ